MLMEPYDMPEIPRHILGSLILKEECNRYELAAATNHAYSAIYKATKILLKYELIEISKKEKNRRNPNIEVEYYRIKPLGILSFLRVSTTEFRDYLIGVPSPSYSLIDGTDKKWRSIFYNLLNYHPYLFPEQFQKLSKEIALVICPNYCHFIGGYYRQAMDELEKQQSLSNFGRYYISYRFLDLIEAKVNKKLPDNLEYEGSSELAETAEAYIKRLCQLMSKKDLEIIVGMVERTKLIDRQHLKKQIQEIDLLLNYLKDVKSEL